MKQIILLFEIAIFLLPEHEDADVWYKYMNLHWLLFTQPAFFSFTIIKPRGIIRTKEFDTFSKRSLLHCFFLCHVFAIKLFYEYGSLFLS